jgi:hypothetical protein
MKETLATIAILLTFVGYVPYIRDTIRHKTTPHIYTWFTWGFVTAIAFGLQVTHQAGPGAYVTLAAAIICFIIFGFGIRQGSKNVTKSDTVFFALSIVALVLWLFAKQPILSVILVSTVDMLAFMPTIRKSWHKPHEETLISYLLNMFRFCLALLALDRYTLVTSLYPATWVMANGVFCVYLIARRKQEGTKINWLG